MSTFFDIWLGQKSLPPEYHRKWNADWQLQNNSNVYISVPKEYGISFIETLSTDNYTITLSGQLYEKLSITELLDRCVLYIESGKNFNDPAGHYIIFVESKKDNNVHVFTNRFGTYHAYYCEEINNNAISTSYFAVAKDKKHKQLDWEAITGFMAMGYFPDDKTYLQGVSIFQPASYYCFDATLQLTEQKRYWNWNYSPLDKATEYYLEQIREVMQTSLATASENKRAAIPVSGGLDSRMLAGELAQQKSYSSLRGLTYGLTNHSKETKIGKQVADTLRIPIHNYNVPNYLFDKLDDITEAVELFQYVDGTRQASAIEWLADNSDITIGGHWGDVWLNDMKVGDEKGLLPAFHKKVIKKGAKWLLDNVCQNKVSNANDYLNDYFTSFINKYNHFGDTDFRFKIYKTDQWSFRWTAASLRMYQPGAFPVLPFYDKRIADIFCTTPKQYIQDRQLQIDYIKHYHPQLAKIRWQEYDSNLYKYKYLNNRNLVYRGVSKVKRTLNSNPTIQRSWELFYLNPEGKKNLEQILLNNNLFSEIVSEEKIKELLYTLHNKPDAANGYSVSMLLTFALFLEKVMN